MPLLLQEVLDLTTGCKLSVGLPAYSYQPRVYIGNLADGLTGLSRANVLSSNYDGISIWELGNGTRYMDANAWHTVENANRVPRDLEVIDVSTGTATNTETVHQVSNDLLSELRVFFSWIGALAAGGPVGPNPTEDSAACEIVLWVNRPDGSPYEEYHMTESSETISIKGAETGN